MASARSTELVPRRALGQRQPPERHGTGAEPLGHRPVDGTVGADAERWADAVPGHDGHGSLLERAWKIRNSLKDT